MHVPAGDDGGAAGGGLSKQQRMLLDALAGAAAGCASRIIVAPLDLVKIRLQVQLEPVLGASAVSKYTGFTNAVSTVLREEGVLGLWRGTVPGLLLTVPYTAVQFVALQQVKDAAARFGWAQRDGPWSSVVSLGSGAVAGAAATVASYPFDLLRTTLAAQGEPKVYRSMIDAARGICREHGVVGLYRGLGVTLVEIVPYAALQFGLYDALSAAWTRAAAAKAKEAGAPPPPPDKLQAFTCGLLAGLVAKLASHPLDVAKKRYQVAGLPRSLRYGARVESRLAARPLLACLADIYQREGLAGLWKGSVPSMIKAAPAAALTFTAYEALVAWMLAGVEARQAEERQAGEGERRRQAEGQAQQPERRRRKGE
ncbi:hypothetical protein Rsub_08262 [Raphidocelis subcapitata]|uniref:Mitochondrial thiamine pyrophosphate carrier n=1 Tax=Raphidocelis subcapitata TaxID=307507 RepID=A0A2V0P7L2_9CHLO|nr:hypothetical protein Rsub_08262 [Raphidocelis subcapitata]|eukprot:GBF95826.1 hypothetical protein Rsub_08262 [Raphidocelis subcapitata]